MEIADLERELERLHGASYGWSLACCGGNPSEAEDVLQSVYLKILEGSARFHGRSTLKTWLFAVIRRTAAGRRRRAAWRRLLIDRWGPPPPTNPGPPDPEARLGRSERRDRVRDAVAALSHRQRQVLELVFYQDLTLREAAAVMGVSLGTASVHYDRGKRQLRGLIGEGEAG